MTYHPMKRLPVPDPPVGELPKPMYLQPEDVELTRWRRTRHDYTRTDTASAVCELCGYLPVAPIHRR